MSTTRRCQPVGHAGLTEETKAALEGAEVVPTVIHKAAEVHHQIAFNVVPHVDVFPPDTPRKSTRWRTSAGRSRNEPDLKISDDGVCAYRSHSESINTRPASTLLDEVRALLEQSPEEGMTTPDASDTPCRWRRRVPTTFTSEGYAWIPAPLTPCGSGLSATSC